MIFFVLSNTRYRAKEVNRTLHLVLLISFNEKQAVHVSSLFSLLKKTRKTVFQGFSKPKLLEVIRHYRITYSQPSNKLKTPCKRIALIVCFPLTILSLTTSLRAFEKFENHDIQDFREVEIKQKMKFFDKDFTKCPGTWNRSSWSFCLRKKDIHRSGK